MGAAVVAAAMRMREQEVIDDFGRAGGTSRDRAQAYSAAGPGDCIYEGPDQLYIHPDECIDCGACEPECPVTAIFPEEDVPANMKAYIQLNREVFQSPTPPGRPNR